MPDLRTTAVHGLARRLLAGDLRPVVVQTPRAALGDGGTRVSSALAAALAGQSGPIVYELREGLRSSPSASVRALAASD